MTKTANQMDFYYENKAEQFIFYRVPKILFKYKRFSKLSSDAKLLYALFLDRMSLSKKNGWVDEERRVYIYFSIQEIMREFNIATEKCTKIIAELDNIKGCGLIHKKKQGQGKPAKIYVMKYTSANAEDDVTENIEKQEQNADEEFIDKEYMKGFIVEGTLDNPRIVTLSNPYPKPSKIKNKEFRKSKNKGFEIRKTRVSKFEI